MSWRSSAVNFSARAFPPRRPPSLPRATAAGFFSGANPTRSDTRAKYALLATLYSVDVLTGGLKETFDFDPEELVRSGMTPG
jgi:hypothetical protein